MASATERLAALKGKLEKARSENLKAVEDEVKRQPLRTHSLSAEEDNSSDDENAHSAFHDGGKNTYCKRPRKRTKTPGLSVDVGSADEADGEDDDDRLRSMKRRARNMSRQAGDVVGTGDSKETIVTYGVTGNDAKPENVDKMVGELRQIEKRREKFRRRRAFHEDRSDITFINEGNRLFNRTLDKHFDKFESVKKLKDSLERGTA